MKHGPAVERIHEKEFSITPLVDRLFVYGTLRLGSANVHAEALATSGRFIGHAKIRGRLYRVAHYPGLVAPQNHDEWVVGDLFEGITSEMIQRLDEYEGTDYIRQLAEVTMEDGRSVTAYLYRYALPVDERRFIASGDWNSLPPSQPE